MEESRITDAVVDEIAFKRKRIYEDRIDLTDCPHYSTNRDAAEELVRYLRARGCKVVVGQTSPPGRWWCEVYSGGLVAAMPICKGREEAVCWAVAGSHSLYWMLTNAIKRFG